jgi:hypothetical protein
MLDLDGRAAGNRSAGRIKTPARGPYREANYMQSQEMGSRQSAPRPYHYIAVQLAAALHHLDRLLYSLTLIDETTNQVTPTSRPIGD